MQEFGNGRTVLRGTHAGSIPGAPDGGHGAKESGVAQGTGSTCPNPMLGSPRAFGVVAFTGTVVNKCLAGDPSRCSAQPAFVDPEDVGLDYGNFPFSREIDGKYFYAVVAAGYEDGGFFQGRTGNLSDDVASAVSGDLGSGDTVADRTLVVEAAQIVKLLPASHGTHAISFPPSQFETIQLAPFDTTPEGKYVLAICPTAATTHCDCAFEAFTVLKAAPDGGTGGRGAGGASGTGGERDASADDARAAGGSGHDAGRMCPDM